MTIIQLIVFIIAIILVTVGIISSVITNLTYSKYVKRMENIMTKLENNINNKE